jgi:hypothetical protein
LLLLSGLEDYCEPILLRWRERERDAGWERQRCTHVYVRYGRQAKQASRFRRVDAQCPTLPVPGWRRDRWQSTDEALAAELYMLEEQARPSVPSKSDEPLGATTLHAAIGGSTMGLLHEQIGRGYGGLSRRICRLADSLPRICPCPTMKSRGGAIRVEVHVARSWRGSVAHDGT